MRQAKAHAVLSSEPAQGSAGSMRAWGGLAPGGQPVLSSPWLRLALAGLWAAGRGHQDPGKWAQPQTRWWPWGLLEGGLTKCPNGNRSRRKSPTDSSSCLLPPLWLPLPLLAPSQPGHVSLL